MSRQYNEFIDNCIKKGLCEYCQEKECNCYEEVMYNIYLEEEQEIFDYLNR